METEKKKTMDSDEEDRSKANKVEPETTEADELMETEKIPLQKDKEEEEDVVDIYFNPSINDHAKVPVNPSPHEVEMDLSLEDQSINFSADFARELSMTKNGKSSSSQCVKKLQDDSLRKIFSHLPVKSIARNRSLSKSMAPRWKWRGAESKALAEPISNSISELKLSLTKTQPSGLLSNCNVLLMVEPEQVELLDRCCFGRLVLSAKKVKKWIQLTFEEAFYLLHNLKCIKISLRGSCLEDEADTWLYMKSKRPEFPIFFKAYSHLRSKNWVLRSGLQYGVDFVAYRHHPSLVHAEYSVLIQYVDSDRLRVWSDIHCIVRLSGSVAKTLLALYVNGNFEGDDLNVPSCLEKYTVEEQMISRWSSQFSRDDETTNSKPNVTTLRSLNFPSRYSISGDRRTDFGVSGNTRDLDHHSKSMGPRWKWKGAQAKAFAEPISNSISELKLSLAKTKPSGSLSSCNVLLVVEPEQAKLLDRCCFGRLILSAEKVKKWIQLTFEEAFYLLHNLKCIKISLRGSCLEDEADTWLYMKSKRPNFPVFFKAYSHIRSKNWVLRSGLQYGVDFVAYRHHPSFVHAEYSVLVQYVDSDRLRVWSDIHCTVRLSGSVAKTLLALYVNGNFEGEDSNVPSCLGKYTVEEHTISRWSPQLSREDETTNFKP